MRKRPEYVPYAQLPRNSKVSTTIESAPLSLMLGRRSNELQEYEDTQCGAEMGIALWKKCQEAMKNLVCPAVSERASKKKGKMICQFAKKRRVPGDDAFPKGAVAMMLDKAKEFKWDPTRGGPFIVVRKNRGRACILRDGLGETLKRAAPPDQLKLARREHGEAVLQRPSFEIKKVADHRYGASKNLSASSFGRIQPSSVDGSP